MVSKEMEKPGCQSSLRLQSTVSYCSGMAEIYKHISIAQTPPIRYAHTARRQCSCFSYHSILVSISLAVVFHLREHF